MINHYGKITIYFNNLGLNNSCSSSAGSAPVERTPPTGSKLLRKSSSRRYLIGDITHDTHVS